MRPLHHSIFAACIFTTLSVGTTAVQGEPASLWDHNNSVIGLYAEGASRIFRYQKPRIAMQQEGVMPGALLFSGTKFGDTYSGTAYVFSRRCGARPYYVTGTVADDGRAITLLGTAPAGFDSACRPILYRQDVLQFSFLRSLAPAPPPLIVGSIDRDEDAAREAAERARREEAHAAAERDLRKQQERTERIRREQEEQRLAELRAFSREREDCGKYNITACDTALRSPHATAQDTIDLRNWRGVAQTFYADLNSCMTGSLAACDAALISPAMTNAHRPLLNEWRTAASPLNRALALLSTYAGMIATGAAHAVAAIRNLPTSTHVAAGIAAVLALALAAFAMRSRHVPAPANAKSEASESLPPNISPSQASRPANETAQPAPAWRERLSDRVGWFAPISRRATTGTAAESKREFSATTPAVRDTPSAIAALELAHAYIEEVREADAPDLEDQDMRKHHLNTLALAAKQLDAAQTLDPDASLEGQNEKEIPYRFSINELKAEALLCEGLTHQTYDTKRAIPALRKATTLNPNSARAFYVLGLTHAANMNKAEAVAAFERAVALDPKNLAYRKELNRAGSLSPGEIAAYKATRAGEKIFDAGVKTANAGIFVYNIGVYAWNIFAVTWNIVTFPFRIVLKIFGVFDRVLGVK